MKTAAQNDMTTYSGRVTNTAGKGVGNVKCKQLNGKASLLAYSLTGREGTYRLKAVDGGRRIEFAFPGYEMRRIPLKEGGTVYDTQLKSKAVELKIVTVTADPITRHKDTLLYNVGIFLQKQGRSIERHAKAYAGHRGEQ